MTDGYDEEQGSALASCWSVNRVRRFQAAFACQMALVTGRRIGELLPLEGALLAQLKHLDSRTELRYMDSGKCFVGSARQAHAYGREELFSCYTDEDAPESLEARDTVTPLSPYCRVYQDMSREDALSEHLSALHMQLKD